MSHVRKILKSTYFIFLKIMLCNSTEIITTLEDENNIVFLKSILLINIQYEFLKFSCPWRIILSTETFYFLEITFILSFTTILKDYCLNALITKDKMKKF